MEELQFSRRVQAVRNLLDIYDCEAFFSVNQADNAYLSGFWGSTSVVLVLHTEVRLLCDFRYAEQASKLQSGVVVCERVGNLDKQLGEELSLLGLQRVAFDPGTITVARLDDIKSTFAGELYPYTGMCQELRQIKEPGELQRIQTACQITEESVESFLKTLRLGITECEAAGVLDYEFRKRGAYRNAFESIVLFGSRSSLPHGIPSDNQLTSNDIVLIDCGCIFDGYCADLTRTFFFGKILPDWFREVYQCVWEAQAQALNAVSANVRASAVDFAARSVIDAAGYNERFGHGTGHGVGIEVHEPPRLNAQSEAILSDGMVVTIEPGIYIPGQGGVRIEDLVAVTESGCSVFTTSTKELRILSS